jgi:hypothetical protein
MSSEEAYLHVIGMFERRRDRLDMGSELVWAAKRIGLKTHNHFRD